LATTGWSGGNATGEIETEGTAEETETGRWRTRSDYVSDRQQIQQTKAKKASEVAETKVATADEGDEGEANYSSGGDRQGGDRQNRTDGDRQGDESALSRTEIADSR
jgi:hypothetical protein